MTAALDSKVSTDATTRNALTKLQVSLSKVLTDAGPEEAEQEATEVGDAQSPEQPSQIQEDADVTIQQQLEGEMTNMEVEPDAEGTIFTQDEDGDTVMG